MQRASFGSWIKERGIFVFSATTAGLQSSIKEHDSRTAGAAFQVRYLVGRVFCNLATVEIGEFLAKESCFV